MFCKKCGTRLDPEDKFCPACGLPAGTDPVADTPSAAGETLLSQRTSPLFLAALICQTVTAAVSLLNLFPLLFTLGVAGDYIEQYVPDRSTAEVARGMMGAMGAVEILVWLGVMAIVAVLLTGLWMVYASGRSEGREATLVRGLKLIRGSLLAQMIYMIVGLGMVAAGCLLLTIAGGMMGTFADNYLYAYDYDYIDAYQVAGLLTTIGLVVLLIVVAVGVLAVIFYVKARRAVGYALDAAQTGQLTGVPALYLVVMCFVSAGVVLLAMLSGTGGALAVVSALVNAAASILFGILAARCRSLAAQTA